MNKKEAIAIIRSLLSSTNSPYSVCSLNKDFKNETGTDIPLFGYKNVNDFLDSIPGTVKLTGMYPIQQVHLVSHEKSAHIVSLVNRQKSSSKRGKRTKGKYYCSSYRQRTENSYNIEGYQLENDSMEDCMEFIKNDFEAPQESSTPKDSSLTSTSNSNIYVNAEDVLGAKDKILPVNLHLHAIIGYYVEVCPTEVCNPNKFYLCLRRYKRKFKHLMDKMQIVYEGQSEYFKMPNAEIKPERICAVLHRLHSGYDAWYRAEILKRLNDTRVIVNLIDHGIIANVLKENLRFLHRKFGSLPRQAIHASLASIKPSKGNIWSRAANERFAELVLNKDLVAGVVDLDPKVPWMSVALSFTKDVEIHVNDTLVKENLAVFSMGVSERQLEEQPFLEKSKFSVSSSGSFSNYTYSDLTSIDKSPIYYTPRNERLRAFLNGVYSSKS